MWLADRANNKLAQRRMFSNRIANSAKFLQMPTESQLLYFHLCLRADDDGVVEAYPLIKLLGTQPDSFKVLLARDFIQQLNEDQVVIVTDWLEHNVIRADRKVDSIYKNILPENIKTIKPRPRSDVLDNSKRLGGLSTDGIGKVRLGKDKLIKYINTPVSKETVSLTSKEENPFVWSEYLKQMDNDKNKAIEIIGFYFKEKNIVFDSVDKARVSIKRWLKTANAIKSFTENEIIKAFDEAKEKHPDMWNLETVYKKLTK